jgi:hypothetical protein
VKWIRVKHRDDRQPSWVTLDVELDGLDPLSRYPVMLSKPRSQRASPHLATKTGASDGIRHI